jgi:molybdopterin synthase catalytic subunit
MDLIEVTESALNLDKLVSFVGSPNAGAISTFMGTTRDNFENKKVVHLEYESYVPMAEKELYKIAQQIRVKWPEVIKVALVHRIGKVEIGEASVIIAISSPHRVDSLEAVHYAIDEIKAVVPIWKKEIYEEGGAWKENKECCHSGPHRAAANKHEDLH